MSPTHNEYRNDQRTGSGSSTTSRRALLVIAGFLIVISAVGLGYWYVGGAKRHSVAGRPVPTPHFDVALPPPDRAGGEAPGPTDAVITIQPEKLSNAHLNYDVAVPESGSVMHGDIVRTTGTVEANAYKIVPVLPVAGGVVRQVNFELGDKVKAGESLATIFSTDLVEGQAAYLNLLAEIEQHDERYNRASQLVEIGAASREEFEAVKAEHKMQQARLNAARQRLALYGMSKKQIDALGDGSQMTALLSVDAPASGTLLSRTVNPGEVVAMGKELFRLADLSVVWVIGQVYEKDFATTPIGTPATITAPAYAGKTFTGRVSYIDPRVESQMRTAQVRIEVRNPAEMLKLGMFVDVIFGSATRQAQSGKPVVSVPRAAVQAIGAKQVVYVTTDQPGIFVQREVTAGSEADGRVPIYSGLNAGEHVVTAGSFLLRAESVKVDPAQLTSASAVSATQRPGASDHAAMNSTQTSRDGVQSVTVILSENGYQPASFRLRQGVPVRLTFLRTVEVTCGTEVVLEAYNIRRQLPLNQPVVVEFTPARPGEFKFACGMGMLRGTVLVH
jgi:RND family efflux transporter MFP subunit